MRELKFRAWDTENKTWTFATLGDLICGACMLNGDKPLSGAEQIWEQYTGLKDKNGKEICEGDIIQTDRGARAIGWNNEYARFGIHETREGFYCFCKLSNFEVIGNIHENSELLEREDGER